MLTRLISLSLIFAFETIAISRDEFYPFGAKHSDSLLGRGDEAVSIIGSLPRPFPFFGQLHQETPVSIQCHEI